MVTFAEARDALVRRLEAVFATLGSMSPGTQRPKVTCGFPSTEPPFYVAVDEVCDTAETSGAVTMGHAQWDFTIRVWAFAQHTSQKAAADTLLSYEHAVFMAVLADPQLDGTVDMAMPSVESAGTAADSSRRYTAAASIAVRCTVYSQCPQEILEVVHATNGNG